MKGEKRCPICLGSKSDFGTDNNKVVIKMPDTWQTERSSRYFEIDSCMVPEVASLWRSGIRTIECCCGHGIVHGYIAVSKESIEAMRSLGYENVGEKDRADLFYPKGRVTNEN